MDRRRGRLTASVRVGVGYDSHRFAPGRELVLGGCTIPFDRGLDGHSDADAVSHAITDAVLGALALGSIGDHFPDTDPQWKDANSLTLLAHAVGLIRDRGYAVCNVDVTVIAEQPRIGPHRRAMAEALAPTLGIATDAVSVKGKTNEGMGFVGRGEGIAAIAVATVEAL